MAFWPIHEAGPQPADLYDLHMHAWAARQVFALRPSWLLDVGSGKPFVTILSQFCPVRTLDIRPWRCDLPGLTVSEGDVLDLPYGSREVGAITCLSVVEHVGLGRYGDALETCGTWKALAELNRVLVADGHLVLAVPIGRELGVLFNAHRILTREAVLDHLPGFVVVSEAALYPEFGPPERAATLGGWGYAMWCAHLRKVRREG